MPRTLSGEPGHKPTAASKEQVAELMAFGITQETICKILKISLPTLHKYYRHELDTGKDIAVQKVARNLFNIATGESKAAVTAACFYLKTQGGWREKDRKDEEQQVILNVNDGVIRHAQGTAALTVMADPL